MYDVDKIRNDFPILQRKVYGKPLVYLDNGATAQKPMIVLEKTDYLTRQLNANVHRGIHFLSNEITREYENARETVRRFINAQDISEVIFTAGATAALNTIAYSYGEKYIREGDNVIVSEMEHHSNIVPWQIVCERKKAELRVLPFDDQGRMMEEKLSGMIDRRTKMIAVTQASNVLGTRPDLNKIINIAHTNNIPVTVDGCQGIVHGVVDVAMLDCDFYVFSGHKLYGPNGTGVLYGKRNWLEAMPPFMGGGDMVNTVTFAKTTYAELPLKFEAGTANYIGAIGMAEAIEYVSGVGTEEIEEHEIELLNYTTKELEKIPGLRIYGNIADKCPIISFTVEGTHPSDIGMILDKMGIAVRTGTHCAEPVMDHYGVTGMCRVSFAMYNTLAEAESCVKGVEKAVAMLRI